MPEGRSDRVIHRRKPVNGPPERDRYEPRSDGRWDYIDEYHNGCKWVARGSQIVDSIGFENVPPQCVDELEVEP
jgi:hypothetical protein